MLIGHGSARYPGAGSVVDAHADALRVNGPFAEVATAFLTGAPTPAEAQARLTAPVVHVVPFFMENGYFTRVAVPRALGLGSCSPLMAEEERGPVGPSLFPTGRPTASRLILHPPIGIHPGFAGVLLARVRAALPDCAEPHPAPAILLLGHGSARAPNRPMAAHAHADALRATGLFPRVETAFLEEPPFLPDALAQIGDCPAAVLGLFANRGTHTSNDMPALIAAARADREHALIDLGIIGDDLGLRPLILDLVNIRSHV